jgi:DNA-binding transcriptional LysR family regulator
MLDVKRMRVLKEVAAQGSFSAAAECLAYTQSAVSQQIAALERETGATLVERNARGVKLTDAGRVLVSHTEAILARLSDAEAELEAIAGLRGGRLRLVAFPSAAASIMPPAIARFRAAHPGVELTLEPEEPQDGLARLRAGEADIALTIEAPNRRDADDGIERTHLLDDPLFVALPIGHALAHKQKLKLGDLADEAWMLGSSGRCPDAQILLRACERAGFEPRIAFQSDDYLAIQGFVAAGVGVCLIPDLALVSVRDDVVIRSLGAKPPFRRVLAGTLKEGYHAPATQAMVDILVTVSKEFEGKRKTLSLAA